MADVPKYDVALSFAGENRDKAEELAEALRTRSVCVFYDAYEKSSLWGKDLYQHLSDVYRTQARFTIPLISAHYAAKLWTRHELKSAQARAFAENGETLLPVRLDQTEIAGILPTVGYLRWPPETAASIAEAVAEKLGRGTGAGTSGGAEAAGGSTIRPAAPNRMEIYDALCALLDAQFDEVIFRLRLTTAHLLPSSVPQAKRATELIERLEQPGAGGLAAIAQAVRKVAPHMLR